MEQSIVPEQQKLSVKEFREQGYLQELNRNFLHPLGLALEVEISEDGEERFGEVWDCRDDHEGVIYGPGMIDARKARNILNQTIRKAQNRAEMLGYIIQPANT